MSAMNLTRRIGTLVAELLESRGVGLAGPRRAVLRRLEPVGLDPEVLDRYPIELSGGMKQRMVVVISTLLNPSLLIADEVTSALDVSTQKARPTPSTSATATTSRAPLSSPTTCRWCTRSPTASS